MTAVPPLPVEVWKRLPPEAQAYVLALRAQLQQLQRRVAELEQRLGQNSTNSSKPPSSDSPHVKRRPPPPRGERPKGGQEGRARHTRPLLPPDHTEHLRPTRCRRCDHALTGDDPNPLAHQVLELPPVKPIVTEYRRHRLRCPRCRTTTCAALPPEVGGTTCGPRLQAAVALLTGACRLSKRTASWVCQNLLGVPLSAAEVCGLERQATQALAPAVAQARAYVPARPVNVDETSWREGRSKGWLWAAVTAAVTVFLIRLSRGAGPLRELLGEHHDRVVTSDRFTTYEVLPLGRRQVCWAHLRRDFQAMIDRGGPARQVGRELMWVSDDLFYFWPRVRDGTWRREQFQAQVAKWRARLRAAPARGTGCGCAKTAATCRELLALGPALWTFAFVGGVEPTNNAAERALRGPVQWRQTSYGTDGAAGSRFVESILTAVASCRQQRRDVLGFVTACCQALRHNTVPPSLIPQG